MDKKLSRLISSSGLHPFIDEIDSHFSDYKKPEIITEDLVNKSFNDIMTIIEKLWLDTISNIRERIDTRYPHLKIL